MQLILNYCNIVDVFEVEPKKADDQKKNRQVKIYVDEEDFFQMLDKVNPDNIAKYLKMRSIATFDKPNKKNNTMKGQKLLLFG